MCDSMGASATPVNSAALLWSERRISTVVSRSGKPFWQKAGAADARAQHPRVDQYSDGVSMQLGGGWVPLIVVNPREFDTESAGLRAFVGAFLRVLALSCLHSYSARQRAS